MRNLLITAGLAGLLVLSWTGRYTPIQLDSSRPAAIQTEIKGEVAHPGVYELDWNATVQDLIAAAGGLSESADLDTLNQTAILHDRDVITVQEKRETRRISINTATEEELQALPGIGPAMAQRITEYRSQHPFQSLEELKEVKGIGDKLFEKMQDLICL